MQSPDEHIHEGHRSRMRAKLKEHGSRIFDTYELLEILLYYVVPYRDTNPIAKRLLSRFGSLDGVLRADEADLKEVDGIGEQAAAFIAAVGRLTDVTYGSSESAEPLVFDSFDKAGKYFLEYFSKHEDTNIALLLLDDCMHLQGVEKIPGDNFGSGTVLPKYFISAALKHRATVAIVAYTHRSGIAYPYSGDYETCRMLRYELANLGISLVEQYVVGSNDYRGTSLELRFNSPVSAELRSFLESKERSCRSGI